MVQQLGVPPAVPQDPSSITTTHTKGMTST